MKIFYEVGVWLRVKEDSRLHESKIKIYKFIIKQRLQLACCTHPYMTDKIMWDWLQARLPRFDSWYRQGLFTITVRLTVSSNKASKQCVSRACAREWNCPVTSTYCQGPECMTHTSLYGTLFNLRGLIFVLNAIDSMEILYLKLSISEAALTCQKHQQFINWKNM